VSADTAELVSVLPSRQRVLITGATGFIGRRLVEALVSAGHEVTVLTRDRAKAALLRPPFRLVTDLRQIADDAAVDAVINLAGAPMTNGLWTRRQRRRIMASRLRVTRAVVHLIERLQRRPAVLVSGSAVGWYGLWQDETLTEFDGGKRSFMHRVCEAWEQTARKAEKYGVRVVRLRLGPVLGPGGGMLASALASFKLGSGQQWMSWIERDDLVRLIAHIIADPKYVGAVNATAPMPVTNAGFARELARLRRRPARPQLPALLLRLLAGDLARELWLGGQRVLPDKADANGFEFRHENVRSALSAILSRGAMRSGAASDLVRAAPQAAQGHHSASRIGFSDAVP
jgi:uncharacterized protein (TIGR01777 family)